MNFNEKNTEPRKSKVLSEKQISNQPDVTHQSTKKKIIVLILSVLIISGFTFVIGFVNMIGTMWLRFFLNGCVNLINGVIAFVAMKITKMKLDLDLKNYKQYLIGAGIAVVLSLCFGLIPAVCGNSLIGGHMDYKMWILVLDFLYFFFIIAPTEELIFRVYIQDTIISILPKYKWIAVIISALLFGLWHWINGFFVQVLFTFVFGLIWGFAKYLIKNCKYLGLSLSHGLYDFLNIVIRMFVI